VPAAPANFAAVNGATGPNPERSAAASKQWIRNAAAVRELSAHCNRIATKPQRQGTCDEGTEKIMHRTDAAKWFWPFLGIAALAATIVIGLSAYAQPKAMRGEPDFRMVVTVSAQAARADEVTEVTIEPSRIDVVGTRSPSIVDRLGALLPGGLRG
jgi:hypothetical protein